MATEKKIEVGDDMLLPTGKACGDCVHINRCKAIFGHTETDTRCDWSPSRFRAVKKASMTTNKEGLAGKVLWAGIVERLIGTGRDGRTSPEWAASRIRLHTEQEPYLSVAEVIDILDEIHGYAAAGTGEDAHDAAQIAEKYAYNLSALDQSTDKEGG